MGKDNTGIIVEAKVEYTKQLINSMKKFVYDEIMQAYKEAEDISKGSDDILVNFQTHLKRIPKWNSDEIDDRCNRILKECPFFNDLITAVFISNVKILTSVKLNKMKKKVKINIPPNTKFISKVYSNCAKSVYNDPYLFSPTKYRDITNNMIDVYKIITIAIEDTIRDMLPIENILQSYLDETLNDDDEEDDDIGPPPDVEENDYNETDETPNNTPEEDIKNENGSPHSEGNAVNEFFDDNVKDIEISSYKQGDKKRDMNEDIPEEANEDIPEEVNEESDIKEKKQLFDDSDVED